MSEPKQKLQTLVDLANDHYAAAVINSDHREYFEAAMIGRQLIAELAAQGIVSDQSYVVAFTKQRKIREAE